MGSTYFIYVLKSLSARKSYVGMTDDLGRRLAEHNSAKHFYSKRHIPWSIVHAEKFDTRDDARKREKYFKTAAGRRYLKKHIF